MLVFKLPNNDLYFYSFHLSSISQINFMYVTTLDAVIFLSSVVIEKIIKDPNLHQEGFLPIHSFPNCIMYFQRKF